MFNFIKRHKIASIVTINIIAFIIIIVAIIIHNAKTAVVDIFIAPSDAIITLNGRSYDNFKSHDVLPGTYHVKISMENMQTKEYDITLENQGFIRIWDYLLDENGGYSYYLIHSEDEAILAEIANDEKTKKFLEDYDQAAAILDLLPIKYDAYSADFSEYTQYKIEQDHRDDCPKIICLKIIDGTGNSEQAAKDKIVEKGYNLDNYDISYEYIPLESARLSDE